METKGDGRSRALVELTLSPSALFFSAHVVLTWAFPSQWTAILSCAAAKRHCV